MAFGIPLAAMAAGRAHAQDRPAGTTPLAPTAMDKKPLFPDDVQFWYEPSARSEPRNMAARSSARSLPSLRASSPVTTTAGTTPGTTPPTAPQRKRPTQLARGHRISARDSYLRASNSYRNSEFFLHGQPKDPRIARAYRLTVDCYKRCAELFDPPIVPVEIPYEHTTLPGYLHRPDTQIVFVRP